MHSLASNLELQHLLVVAGDGQTPHAADLALRLEREFGAHVVQAHTPEDLERALRDGASVALCPLHGALAAARAVQTACQAGSHCAVLAYGSDLEPRAWIDALRSGVVDVLRVPAESSDVVARVEHAFTRAQNAKEQRAATLELERYRRFFQAGPVIVFRWRAAPGWPVEDVSPNVVQLFGVSAGDFLSGVAPYSASVHPEDLERVAREVQAHASSGAQSFDQEYRIVRPDGEVRWLYDHTVITRDASGAATHFAGYVLDVSSLERERRTRAEAERLLLQAQKLESLGILAGGVAHDFNNLLTTMLGEATLALGSLAPDAPARTQLGNILTAARSASGLTRQMLAYAGRASATPTPCDLRTPVRDVLRLLESSLPKRVRLNVELGEPATVLADAGQIQQVVMNLVLNAAEACGEREGVISLRLARVHALLGGVERECVQLEVEDNGEGMSPATLARVFEPFFSTKFQGRGLGLSAVRGIVQAHGGELQLSSRVGVGTLARVQLPLSREAVAPKSAHASPAAARGERVLVVDDEPAVARVAARALQHFGYSTAIAASGREALTLLASTQERVDCVLLDRTMPDLSGEETLVLLRERDPQLVVVLTSGYEEAESLIAARRVSPNAFLHKPYAPDELARTVRAALDAARTPQGARPLS